MKQRVIQSSRIKVGFCFAVSLLFTLACAILLRGADDHETWKAWLAVAFFGSLSIVALVWLLRPYRLALNESGFSLSGGLLSAPRKVAWRDIEEFYVWRLPRGGSCVGYKFRPSAGRLPRMVKINRLLGVDDSLPKCWTMGTQALVDELNAYRMKVSNPDAQNSG